MNEEYPPSCIVFRELLQPNQHKFKVPGFGDVRSAIDGLNIGMEAAKRTPEQSNSHQFKCLKPPNRDQLAREPHTPSPVRQSILGSSGRDMVEKQSDSMTAQANSYDDSLQEAIERVKAVKDIVNTLPS